MKVNKIFIDEVQWEDDENPQHGAFLWFKIDDMQLFADYDYLEDISLKWIEADIGFEADMEITLERIMNGNKNKERNIIVGKRHINKFEYHIYQCYGKITSVNPIRIDCGKLILVGSEFDRGPIKELEYPEYVGKYIYYETFKLWVRSYKVVDRKTNRFLSKISIRYLIDYAYYLFGRR